MDGVQGVGAGFAELILSVADLLKGTSAPGAVALALIVVTGVSMIAAQLMLRRACF
ncbi:MAG: hypothetical protein WAO78_16835 [Roseovarius sp.]